MNDDRMLLEPDGGRTPYSVEAEQAVLGAVLIDPKSLNDILPLIKPDYFYIPQHREIYATLSSMYELNQAIDFVSLLENLKRKGVYDEAGGKGYLTQLVQTVPTAANVLTYVSIVRDRYYARALMGVAQRIIKNINENTMDSDALLNQAEQDIFDIRQGREISGLTHIKQVIEGETYDRLAKMADPETRNDYIGIPSGIGELDKLLTGFHKSNLIILGARPGMGKTSFALNITRNVAVNAAKTVCFFSLEMTRDELAQRLLSSEAGIKSEKLRTGELDADEWTRLAQAATNLSSADIYFDESTPMTVPEIMAKVRRLKKPADLIVIDYLGLLKIPGKPENRVQEVSEIARSLKNMAKQLKIPVLACAQLSRGTEGKGKSHKPGLADLRESGEIEQAADIVMFLYRETYYDNEKDPDKDLGDPNAAECIIAKNRHGESGTIKLYWDGQYTRFTSVDVFRDD